MMSNIPLMMTLVILTVLLFNVLSHNEMMMIMVCLLEKLITVTDNEVTTLNDIIPSIIIDIPYLMK